MQYPLPNEALDSTKSLKEIMPIVLALPALDKVRLIRILAEELEQAREIFPFEPGKTYDLPTPYNAFGAADILAEAMAADVQDSG